MTSLVWIVALVLVGLAMMVLEVFVPSGGVLGFLSVVALVAGIVTAFLEQGPWAGMAAVAATCVAVPAVLAAAFRWFPETPLGRRVIPPPPGAGDVVPDIDRRQRLRGLVGRRGRTTCDLLPWGTVTVDGHEVDAISDGGPLDRGAEIEVVGVQGMAVVVRPAAAPVAAGAREEPLPPSVAPRVGEAEPAVSARLEEALEGFDFDAIAREPTRPADSLDSGPPPKQS
jgi:membrane-bound ClpP family serine protease